MNLVLHDSALLMSANWVVENSGLVKSITLLDTKLKDFEHPRTGKQDKCFDKFVDICF